MPDKPDNLLQWEDRLGGQGKKLDVFYLGFSKDFDTISYNILIERLMKYRLEKWTVRWTEN